MPQANFGYFHQLFSFMKHVFKESFWRVVLKGLATLVVLALCYTVLSKWVMPPITTTQLSDLLFGQGLKRDYVAWNEISPEVKLAAIASEDQRFLEHGGIDWKSIEKSMNQKPSKRRRKNKLPKGAGASTITQQTAKNVFLWQGSGIGRYVRKVPEFAFTKLIEVVWGKKRIMEVYLNVIEMGPGIYGIEAAAQAYFHKPASRLTRSEAAMIIACLPNPKRFLVVPMSRRVSWRYPQIVRQMGFLEGDDDIDELIYSP
jgi:monofunctional glycosyltransferase